MNAGDWIALAMAAITTAGALIAWRQAALAKQSARDAGRQATAAEQSATHADRQATAAERQVAIMQRQLENESIDRHEAAAPRFAVKSAVIEDDSYGQPVALLTIEQTEGTAVSEVKVAAIPSENVHGLLLQRYRIEPDYTTGTVTWGGSAPGTEHMLTVSLEYNFLEPVNVILEFASRQAETGQEWKFVLTAVPLRPPPPPRRQGPRRIWGQDDC